MRKITFVCVVAAILCGMICSCTNGVSEKETKKSLMIEVPVPRASRWAEGCSKFGNAETGYRAGRVYRFGNEGTRCGGAVPAYTRNEGGCLV